MSGLEQRVIREALGWVGTPYRHQASCLGAGADCLGLLRGVWRGLYGEEPEVVPAYTADWSEPQGDEVLMRAAERHLISKPVAEPAIADVVLFRMRHGGVAKHLGIQTRVGDAPEFVHAYSGYGVTVSPLSKPWARRIAARFAFPG